ncbi:unnamed protein product [Aspergillus oryzae]|uniref:Unnamed protein product n=2 Tax=Aspergillus oryzae TaxID=5062 RepID=A0AAN5BUK2_ASPOZ|nr:unnamed protein product [Aspergillus oryzae]GMF92893.1 unnamed protein product [Aspergillus oryzae]GMG09193.1 unnamed protein product [Aspergillus oryzae]GMG25984.1 unnamed protein product [Aspergillus oryzae]GMG45364.1 unnamed protein product [Aspergillus oryzae var. brunneus]
MHVQAFILHSCGLTDGVYFQAARIPEGWTCDPGYLQRFFRPGTGRRDMAQYYGLTDPTLVLMETPDTGSMGYIIFSGGRYYGGDLMSDYMFEITRPTTFPEILRAIDEQDFRGLRKKKIKPAMEE